MYKTTQDLILKDTLMKATTIKLLLAKLALILVVSNASAQDLIGTRIDVNKGSNYTDKLWLYTIGSCTNSFDNGWDGFKEIGSPKVPQLFAVEKDGDYQIDATNNLNNTVLGFIAGQDSVYTLTFTHQNMQLGYSKLYLIDSVAKKTIDVYADGSTYTFKATNKKTVKRFKIVSELPLTATVLKPDSIDSSNANEGGIAATSIMATGPAVDNPKNVVTSQPSTGDASIVKTKKIKVYTAQKMIVINNTDKQVGQLNVYNASTGKLVKQSTFGSFATTVIPTDDLSGSYVVYAKTTNEELSKIVIL